MELKTETNNNDQTNDQEKQKLEIFHPFDHGKFFFFGCWNRRGFKDQNKCTDDIVKDIKSVKDHFDFGVILGDNIYPNEKEKKIKGDTVINQQMDPVVVHPPVDSSSETKTDEPIKVKEKKVFFDSKMEAGLASLESIGLPLHIVLGNHDIEDCKMLQYQMNLIPLTKKDLILENWKFKSNLYSELYQTSRYKIRLIIIDTNLLGRYTPEEKKLEKDDYKALSKEKCNALDDPRINIDPEKYYAEFKNMLSIDKNRDIDLIIIAGHEPLLCVKKKSSGEAMNQLFFLNDLMTDVEKLNASKIKVVYICADTHCFLDTYIANKYIALRQIVVGTGGASPDVYDDLFIKDIQDNGRLTKNKQHALIVNNVVNSYGYCSFDVNKFMEEPIMLYENKMDQSIIYRHDENNTTKRDCIENKVSDSTSTKIKHSQNQSGSGNMFKSINYHKSYFAHKYAYKSLKQ